MEVIKFLQIQIFLFGLLPLVSPARILFFHGVASYSHQVQTYPIASALASKGHSIYFLSPFPPKSPNPSIIHINPPSLYSLMDSVHQSLDSIQARLDNSFEPLHKGSYELGYSTCEVILTSPEFIQLLQTNKNQPFDIFIIDNILSECGLAIGSSLQAKNILFDTFPIMPYEFDTIGFQPESSSIPELEHYPPQVPLNFFARLQNTFISLIWYYKQVEHAAKLDKLLQKHLPEVSSVTQLVKNISLVFYTGDPISDYPRALPPYYVNVAGTHCKNSTKPLPKDLEQFISQEGTEGFIYISFGSAVYPHKIPENTRKIFYKVMETFPSIKFLWRWRGEHPKGTPSNLMISQWFPQEDLLGHPKIKGFITQNGRPSTLEAVNAGVPMISFPFMGDQDFNANRLTEVGANMKLEIGKVTFEELKKAVETLVYDKAMKERMLNLQKVFRDRPLPPVETAVWWVEYVLRHHSTEHLKSPGNNQSWFVRRSIDIWAFLTLMATAVIYLILICAIKLVKFVGGNGPNKVKMS